MAHFSLASTSDQIEYDLYPYLAANISVGILPEQAAVWSYPVERHPGGETGGNETDPNNGDRVPTRDSVIINMVNSLLGRMHLASRLNELDAEKKSLVREGVAYYRTFAETKKRALPYFPEGFAHVGQHHLASGLIDGDKIYLAVWYLHGESAFTVTLPDAIRDVKIGYPSDADTKVSFEGNEVHLAFTGREGAVLLEITKK
jgi:alpha-galactosidase